MRFYINKNTFNVLRKSIDDNKLNMYKKKLLAILDKKEDEEKKELKKSFYEFIEKAGGLPPGTKKEWPAGSGKWYVKTGQGKWIRTYSNSGTRGAKQSIAYMRKKIQNAESLEELLKIVQENKDKFTDENGKPIDIVKDLMKDVHGKHQTFKNAAAGAKKDAEKVMNGENTNNDDLESQLESNGYEKKGNKYINKEKGIGFQIDNGYATILVGDQKGAAMSVKAGLETLEKNAIATKEQLEKDKPMNDFFAKQRSEDLKNRKKISDIGNKLYSSIKSAIENRAKKIYLSFSKNGKFRADIKEASFINKNGSFPYISGTYEKDEETGKYSITNIECENEEAKNYFLENTKYGQDVKSQEPEEEKKESESNISKRAKNKDRFVADVKNQLERQLENYSNDDKITAMENLIKREGIRSYNGIAAQQIIDEIKNGNDINTQLDNLQKQALNDQVSVDKYGDLLLEKYPKMKADVYNRAIKNYKTELEQYPKESEAEKYQNRSDAMKGNKNAWKGGKKTENLINFIKQQTLNTRDGSFLDLTKYIDDEESTRKYLDVRVQDMTKNEKQKLMEIAAKNPDVFKMSENGGLGMALEYGKEIDNVGNKSGPKKENIKKQTFADIKKNYQNAKSVQGNSKTIHVGSEKIKCHYKLVEAETPIASHNENTFQKTEGFPTNNGGTINDRDYENDNAAKEGVMRIAGDYDGRALESPPIVTKDGIVVSGNNRTMSSKLAAKNGTDKEYINELKDVIEDYGIDEEELSKFKNPRIILEIDKEHEGEYTTEEFAKYNKTDQKTKSVTEKAVEIAKTIKPEAISNLAEHISEFDTLGELYNNRNAAREFVDSLVINGVIGKNEIAQYYTEQGGLSESGKEFIETTLVGGIMNENNIRSLAGAGGASIRQKLVRAIVPLIDNKGIGKEYTFNDELNKAVAITVEVMQNRDKFKKVEDFLDQGNLFGEEVDPLTGKLAIMLHDNTQKEFAEKMREVEGGLRPSANGEFDLFLGECESRDSVLDRILDISNKVSKALDYVFGLFR